MVVITWYLQVSIYCDFTSFNSPSCRNGAVFQLHGVEGFIYFDELAYARVLGGAAPTEIVGKKIDVKIIIVSFSIATSSLVFRLVMQVTKTPLHVLVWNTDVPLVFGTILWNTTCRGLTSKNNCLTISGSDRTSKVLSPTCKQPLIQYLQSYDTKQDIVVSHYLIKLVE